MNSKVNIRRTSLSRLLLLFAAPILIHCADDDEPGPVETPTPPAIDGMVAILAPYDGQFLVTSSLAVQLELGPDADPATLEVRLNDVPITEFFTFDPELGEARAIGLEYIEGEHELQASIKRADGRFGDSAVHFSARPASAMAAEITEARQLIGGPAALGRVGDLVLQNDKVRFVIQDLGRHFLNATAFGGNLIDADLVRLPWEAGQDQVGSIVPGLNLEDTINPTDLLIINNGSDGGAAIIEARGPDDLLATFNVSSIATLFTTSGLTEVPPSANDTDLPVNLINRFTLEPGKSYLTWETEVLNATAEAASFYWDDFLSMSGNVEFFSPGAGWGEIDIRYTCDWMAWVAHDAAGSYTVGYIPEVYEESTLITLQGFHCPFLGQGALDALLYATPPVFTAPANGSLIMRRWIVLGKDPGAVLDTRTDLLSLGRATISGKITQEGVPVAGARIAALQEKRTGDEVASVWISAEDGTFQGKLLAGNYRIEAGLAGSPNAGYASQPASTSVSLSASSYASVNFDIPAPAFLHVTLVDLDGAPSPGKISIVGFDPSPDPEDVDDALETSVRSVFSDRDRDPMPFGLVQVLFAGVDGDSGIVPVEPGEYAIVASRGPEYSSWWQTVTLTAGARTDVTASLVRILDTPGFAGGDFHVHSIDSFDSPIPTDLRVKTLIAEGLDVFAATEHSIRIDYSPMIAAAGASDLIAGLVGEEITTFDLGHYNTFPVSQVSGPVNLGAIDWAGDAPVGEGFPSLGHYNLSPSDLAYLIAQEPDPQVIQLNHPNNEVHGHFSLNGVNTAITPPFSYVPASLFRQDPAITNLYFDGYTAMEIWRGYTDEPALVFEENLGDYFNLLNQGIVRAITSNSDTHSSIDIPTGGPRNWIAVGDAVGTALAAAGSEIATALNERRIICSNGPFLEVTLETDGGIAGHAADLPTQVSATGGAATVHIQVSSAAWAAFDAIDLYINNAPYPMADNDDAPGQSDYQGVDLSESDVPRYEVAPDLHLVSGVDFTIETVTVDANAPGAQRFEATVDVPLLDLTQDSWVMVVAKGTEGVSAPLFPVLPAGLDSTTNVTLDDLLDGNVGEGGILALAITNPLFLDVDGDGQYTPPGVILSDERRAPAMRESERIRKISPRHH